MATPEQVTYLGPKASYTHQAALSAFPSTPLTPSPTIPSIFAAIQSGAYAHGVVPFENSSNGAVLTTLDLLADRSSSHPHITVTAEVYVRVSHCLLGHAAPDGGLAHIKRLHSHPQAWGQVTRFLGQHLEGIERRDEASTSAAAGVVKGDASRGSAAVCSELAAGEWGLDVLARGIEDSGENCTRFLVISRGEGGPDGVGKGHAKAWKSLLSFTPRGHKSPGALAEALSVFAKEGIDLTSINARPSGERNWEYVFLVEFVGRIGDAPVDRALEEVKAVVGRMRFLGSWESRG